MCETCGKSYSLAGRFAVLRCKCGGTFTNMQSFKQLRDKIRIVRRCTYCKETLHTEEKAVVKKDSRYPRGILPPVIKKMRQEGMTYPQISAETGYSVSTVWEIGEGLRT